MPTVSEIWHMFTIYDILKLPHLKKTTKNLNSNTQTTTNMGTLGYKQII